MIAKSDLVILAISGTLLATAIYRWQGTVQPAAISPTVTRAPAQQVPSTARQTTANTPVVARAPDTPSANTDTRQSDTPVSTVSDTQSETNGSSGVEAVEATTANSAVSSSDSANTSADLYGTYTVLPGDNLTYIANILGTSVDTLRSINDIEGSLIYIDQELLYPLPAN